MKKLLLIFLIMIVGVSLFAIFYEPNFVGNSFNKVFTRLLLKDVIENQKQNLTSNSDRFESLKENFGDLSEQYSEYADDASTVEVEELNHLLREVVDTYFHPEIYVPSKSKTESDPTSREDLLEQLDKLEGLIDVFIHELTIFRNKVITEKSKISSRSNLRDMYSEETKNIFL